MLALFAKPLINGVSGLFYGGTKFFFIDVGTVIFVSAYVFVISYILLIVINKITPVRISSEEQEKDVDEALHGEEAYLI